MFIPDGTVDAGDAAEEGKCDSVVATNGKDPRVELSVFGNALHALLQVRVGTQRSAGKESRVCDLQLPQCHLVVSEDHG